jgi:hypothetical protein
MSYEADRIESWARKIYEETKEPGASPWEAIKVGRAADRWRDIARAAIRVHLGCCERRCAKCGDALVHHCLHCERV